MKNLLFVLPVLFFFKGTAQTDCTNLLKSDSCALQISSKKELVEIAEVKIKNNYQVQFIKQDQKKYLKLIIKDDLGFGKKGSLLLYCNKKQIYVKMITLQIIDKTSAYFLIELIPNYITTLKENGLTNIIFCEKIEFVVPKQDSEAVKKMAACFYDLVVPQPKKL